MQDRDLVLDAIEDAQRILAEHIEPASHQNPETTINMLLFLLDRREVVAAVRLARGSPKTKSNCGKWWKPGKPSR